MLPLQVPGGPEMLIVFLFWGLLSLLPVVAGLIGLYLLYRIRQDTASMAESLQRIAESGTTPAGAPTEPEPASATGPDASASDRPG